MAKVSRAASRSVHVMSSPQDVMTVWALREFVRALDEEGVPGDARVEAHRNESTMHLAYLTVRHTVSLDPDAAASVGELPPGSADA